MINTRENLRTIKGLRCPVQQVIAPTQDVIYVGAKMLDLLEELKDEKRSMWQWTPNVIDNSYSSKLHIQPIRKLVEYISQQGTYHNPRSLVEPSLALLRQTPMSSQYYDAYNSVCKATKSAMGNHHQTALQVLKFFYHLNKLLLVQDTAAILVLYSDCSWDLFFQILPFLTSNKFNLFKGEMRKELIETVDLCCSWSRNMAQIAPKSFCQAKI